MFFILNDNENENVSVQFNNSNVCKEDIIQGYRYRYNHIDCEHKKFTFIQKVPVHFAAPGSRLNSSFRCAKMRYFFLFPLSLSIIVYLFL